MDPIRSSAWLIIAWYICHQKLISRFNKFKIGLSLTLQLIFVTYRRHSQIASFMGPTWGPPGSCRPQMGPMLAPWTLLSGLFASWYRARILWLPVSSSNQHLLVGKPISRLKVSLHTLMKTKQSVHVTYHKLFIILTAKNNWCMIMLIYKFYLMPGDCIIVLIGCCCKPISQ